MMPRGAPLPIVRIGPLLVVAALCLSAIPARASSTSELTSERVLLTHAVAVEYGFVQVMTAGYQHSAQAAGLSYRLLLSRSFELAAGFRGLWGPRVIASSAFEGFGSASLVPDFGRWRPRIGLELGYSRLVTDKRPPDVSEPRGIDQDYRAAVSPVYAAIAAAPLRMRIWQLDIAVLELDAGTTIPDFGRALRLTVMFGQVSWRI
jgi:hypothetical protein